MNKEKIKFDKGEKTVDIALHIFFWIMGIGGILITIFGGSLFTFIIGFIIFLFFLMMEFPNLLD